MHATTLLVVFQERETIFSPRAAEWCHISTINLRLFTSIRMRLQWPISCFSHKECVLFHTDFYTTTKTWCDAFLVYYNINKTLLISDRGVPSYLAGFSLLCDCLLELSVNIADCCCCRFSNRSRIVMGVCEFTFSNHNWNMVKWSTTAMIRPIPTHRKLLNQVIEVKTCTFVIIRKVY